MFSYKDVTLDNRKDITLTVKDESVESILNKVLVTKGLTYTKIGNTFAIKPGITLSTQVEKEKEKKKITGTVADEHGEPIIGVNVVEKGTANGLITDVEGEFILLVADNATLQISYIGYINQEIQIRDQTILQIILKEDTRALDEVIVIGYGSIKKSNLTGAVSSIKTSELQQTPIVSIDQGLVGRASGVQVVQNSGIPGAVASIRVRGSSSLQGGNEPLYVIDGFPVYNSSFGNTGGQVSLSGLSTINPSDIESIEILKDASATAIYGARAANGVVLITTKSGKRGHDMISFESSFGFSRLSKKIDVMGAQEYAQLVNEAYTNDGLKPIFSTDALANIATLGKGTDWQDEIYREGFSQNYQLTFSGGDEKTQYAITGSYYDQRGIIINSDFKRYSTRLNFDRKISGQFSVGSHLTASHTIANLVPTSTTNQSGVVVAAMKMNPIQPIYSDESAGVYTDTNTPGIIIANPVATARELKQNNAISQFLGDIYAQWEIIKDLKLKVTLGGNIMYYKANQYIPSVIYQGRVQNSATITVNRIINWLNENTLTWDTQIGKDHSVNILGGFTMQRNNRENVQAASAQFVNDIMLYNNLGSGAVYNAPSSSAIQWSIISYLARINYNLKDRYLFSLNSRIDGSSRFGQNNKYGFFPSLSAGWRISEESFMKSLKDIFPNIKLRGSYGFTGNTEIGVYESLATLTSSKWIIGNEQVSGFYPDKIPNPDLKWEKTGQLDFGLDLGLFNNRLSLTVDYYEKKTTDLLYNVVIPGTSGYQTMLKNIGSVKNYGTEFSIESKNLVGAFSWDTNFNISFNKNKVLELGGEEFKELAPSAQNLMGITSFRRLVVGKPIGIFYGYRFDGIFQNEEECKAQTSSTSPIGLGLRRYKDLNGDGKIDANDREILGNSNPKFFGGISNTFSYKGFGLNVFLQYSYGNKIFNWNALELETPTGGTNVSKELVNRWTPDHPSTIYPKATTNRTILVSDYFVEEGSYLKLKTLSLSYGFPKLNISHISGLRLFVTAQDLLTWTKYKGFDPDVSFNGEDALRQGEDFGSYPQSKTIMVGLKFDIK
jgi:TonB-linked SusC/RagA family outer membrane protein